jgi:hypothetical protein
MRLKKIYMMGGDKTGIGPGRMERTRGGRKR